MKYFFTLLFSVFTFHCFSQTMEYGCLIIKSDPSRPFKLYIDSTLVTPAPKYCIRAEHLEKYSYNIMILFQDSSLNQIVKPKLFICNKKGIKREFTYELIQDSGMMKASSMMVFQWKRPTMRPIGTMSFQCTISESI